MKHEDVLKRLRQDAEYVKAEEELRPLLDIADTVLRLRMAKGWSQSELARRVGTKQANISKLENGLANPTIDFLRRVAQALETDLTIRLDSEQFCRSKGSSYVVQDVHTVDPDILWKGQSPQRATPTQWICSAFCAKHFVPAEQNEVA